MEYVLEPREKTKVYVSDHGWVCISQEDSQTADEGILALHPDDIPQLVDFLMKAMKEAKEVRASGAEK